ncbi:AzlD domain-containing protein [Escherichia coli]
MRANRTTPQLSVCCCYYFHGWRSVLLDTIGIASICALLVVSTAPEVMHDTRRFVPTLVGFAVLGASFYKTRSIIIPTLLSALTYGLVWKVMAII